MLRAGFALAALCVLTVASCGNGRATLEFHDSVVEQGPDAPAVSSDRAAALGLTPKLPDRYRRICDEQAAAAPAGARACPPLIPTGRLDVIYADPFGPRPRVGGGYLADLSNLSLRELERKRIETNGGHWHYDVSWTPEARRALVRRGVQRPANADRPSRCRPVQLGSESVEACRVVPYEKGGGLNGGHIAYVWSHGPATYVVSLHGYANEPRARAMTEALIAVIVRDGAGA